MGKCLQGIDLVKYVRQDLSESINNCVHDFGVSMSYTWCCPDCGEVHNLRMRVTQTKRKCGNCDLPITTEEIDRQAEQAEMRAQRWAAEVAERRAAESANANAQRCIVIGVVAVMFIACLVFQYFSHSGSSPISSQVSTTADSQSNNEGNISNAITATQTSGQTLASENQSEDISQSTPPAEGSSLSEEVRTKQELPSKHQAVPTVVTQPERSIVQNGVSSEQNNSTPIINPAAQGNLDRSSNISSSETLVDQALAAQSRDDQTAVEECIRHIGEGVKPIANNAREALKLNKLGVKQLKNQSYNEAVRLCSSAVEDDPSEPEYVSNLGFAEMHYGDLASAEKHLRSAISLEPTHSVAWGNLALVLAKKGDASRAVDCFLIAYHTSKRRNVKFLKSILEDEDPAIRNACKVALDKIESARSQ